MANKKVVFCIPTLTKPYQVCLDSLKASIPLIKAAGWDEGMVMEVGCPYISAARATLLRKALDANADVVVFIDHDLSWEPQDLLTLIEARGEVTAGTYRFKRDKEEYMGEILPDVHGRPRVREDGCVLMNTIPAGFLKITKGGVSRFMMMYPELLYVDKESLCVDIFNHGVHKGVWYGEDYAFCRRWNESGGQIWGVPNINVTHHTTEKAYPGNFHEYLLACPGGSNSANPQQTGVIA
jgi:glycosyltransferase involved in cell wall biosynthesis